MKSIITTLLTAAMFFQPFNPSRANTGVKDTESKPFKAETERSTEIIKNQLLMKVSYPRFFKNEVNGKEVSINFSINKNKEIVINEVKSDLPYLIQYIRKQLQNTKIVTDEPVTGKDYNAKFVFISL